MEERACEEGPTRSVLLAGQNWKRITSQGEDLPSANVPAGEESGSVKRREGSSGRLELGEQ